MLEEGVLDPSEIIEGQEEVVDLMIELGALGIGIAGAAMAYYKYKDTKLVKDAVSTAKQLTAEGKKKWGDSEKTRKQILFTSAKAGSNLWESSSEYRNKIRTIGEMLFSKVKKKL